MPKFEALYYPNFEPPAIWLRSFLLFFDEVKTIVPEDVNLKLSSNISEIVDLIPDAFDTISPTSRDITLNDLDLIRMKKAFEVIKKKEPTAIKKITISQDGKICK